MKKKNMGEKVNNLNKNKKENDKHLDYKSLTVNQIETELKRQTYRIRVCK